MLEHFQWKNPEEMARHAVHKKDDIAEELADVLSYLLLLADKLDVDMVKALEKKMKKNEAKYPVAKAKGSHKKYTELA